MIVLAVRWYLRFNLSYRDVEELLVERGVEVDHVTVYRWVQRFTPLLADAARFARHCPGDRWFVDETYVKVNGVWKYVYRAVDQHGQVIDVLVSARRDAAAARRFLHRALTTLKVTPSEVVTDAAPAYVRVLEDLIPSAWHHVERHANNPTEADHSQLKHRLRPMRGLRTDRTAQTIPDTWRLDGALIYQPAQNDAQSVWWIFGADGGFSGWYVNLERRVHDGADIDVFDAELDLLVTPDHQWRWKDEESFAQKTGHPRFWSTAEAVAIRERGLRLARLAETRSFPFDGTWCDFRPDPAWEPPPLPASDGAYRGEHVGTARH